MDLIKLFRSAVRPTVNSAIFVAAFESDDEDEVVSAQGDRNPDAGLSTITGLSLILDYRKSDGRASQRLVTCRKLSSRGGVEYLSAFCHAKQRLRTFRVDRVTDAFEPETGASVGPIKDFLSQFSVDEVTQSGLSWGLSVRKRADLIALLNSLIFVARCDREYHSLERDTIESVVTRFWIRMEIAGEPDCDAIQRYSDRLSPDGEIFWLSMQRFSEAPLLAAIFKQAVREVIDADGVQHESEFYWAREIDEFFAENG